MAESLQSEKIIRLFNCDRLYDLNIVGAFLRKEEVYLPFTLSIHHHNFPLPEMKNLSEELAYLEMDYAVFVVHANESRLSINEKNAGIGYARIFTALKESTGDKVLVVIGGDNHYEGEEDEVVLSHWAKYKISTQFPSEYLDGRKSFVFSWNKEPNPIHYQALKHFFLKQGEVFDRFDMIIPKPTPIPKIPPTPQPLPPPARRPRYYGFIINGEITYEMTMNCENWRPDSIILNDWKRSVEDKNITASLIEVIDGERSPEVRIFECKKLLRNTYYIKGNASCFGFINSYSSVSQNEEDDEESNVIYKRSNWFFNFLKSLCRCICSGDVNLEVVHKSFLVNGKQMKGTPVTDRKLPRIIFDDVFASLEFNPSICYLEVCKMNEEDDLQVKVYQAQA